VTTIACDGESMSSDSLETAGDVIVGRNVRKMWRLKDGRIVGGAGRVSDILKVIEWLETDGKKPTGLKECSVLVLHPNGKCDLIDESGVPQPQELPAAIGTGYISALTAMDLGKSTADAIKAAIQRDAFSAGKVQTLRLSDNL
jgi:20S proteasome alpha/beta subunit